MGSSSKSHQQRTTCNRDTCVLCKPLWSKPTRARTGSERKCPLWPNWQRARHSSHWLCDIGSRRRSTPMTKLAYGRPCPTISSSAACHHGTEEYVIGGLCDRQEDCSPKINIRILTAIERTLARRTIVLRVVDILVALTLLLAVFVVVRLSKN